jgi:hypothetical protein
LGFEISCEGPCPPENDNIAAAWYPSFGFPVMADTRAATLEAGEERPCGNIGNTVWYRFDAAQAGEFRISTAGSDFSTVLAVYEFEGVSPPGGARNVACVEGTDLNLHASAGHSYLLQVGGAGGAGGILQARIDCDASVCQSWVYPVDTGQGGGGPMAGGSIGGPDTGSGGYLPGARR